MMNVCKTISGAVEYRVALVHPDLRTMLVVDGTNVLPRIRIPQMARRTEALRKAIEAEWNLRVFVVDFVGDDSPTPCVIAEADIAAAPSDLTMITLNQIPGSEFSEIERTEVGALLSGSSKHEVSRIGWADEARAWVETETHRRISTKGDIEQFSAGARCALVRFHTDDGSTFWLKAVSGPHRHECAVTTLLSILGTEYLPRFIAAKPEWNAWLMSGEGIAMAELPAGSLDLAVLLENAVRSMAELQIRTIGHREALLRCGAFDQNVQMLAANSQELFAYLEEAMSLQTSTRVARLTKDRLREIRSIFVAVCHRLIELNLPVTILHGDVNPENIVVQEGNCKFIDWAEAYLGNPFITLQHMLLMSQSESPRLAAHTTRLLTDRYCAVLEQICLRTAIDEALAYMPLIAAASALYRRGDWLGSVSLQASRNHAYDRTLARHIDRAARNPELLMTLAPGFRTTVSSSAASSSCASAGAR